MAKSSASNVRTITSTSSGPGRLLFFLLQSSPSHLSPVYLFFLLQSSPSHLSPVSLLFLLSSLLHPAGLGSLLQSGFVGPPRTSSMSRARSRRRQTAFIV